MKSRPGPWATSGPSIVLNRCWCLAWMSGAAWSGCIPVKELYESQQGRSGTRILHNEPKRRGRQNHDGDQPRRGVGRSEEHTSELQSLMRISYAVLCLKKK